MSTFAPNAGTGTSSAPWEQGQQFKLWWKLLHVAPTITYLYSLHDTSTRNEESRTLAQPARREGSLRTYLKVTCVKIDILVQRFTSTASWLSTGSQLGHQKKKLLSNGNSTSVCTNKTKWRKRNGGGIAIYTKKARLCTKEEGVSRGPSPHVAQRRKSRNGCCHCFFD